MYIYISPQYDCGRILPYYATLYRRLSGVMNN